MTSQNWLQFVIDWVGLPALAFLAGVLFYRRWYREFPFFFFYIVGAEVVGLARLAFMRSPFSLYFQVYWISDMALTALAFLATYELFFKRLFPNFYKTRFYRLLFPVTAILILLVALTAIFGGHTTALKITTRVYEFLRAGILLFFVALMLVMGRLWSKQEFGIAFGFGLDATTSLALLGIWAHTKTRNEMLSRIAVIAYDIACIVWIYCFLPKPSTPINTEPLSYAKLDEARKSEAALKAFLASTNKRKS